MIERIDETKNENKDDNNKGDSYRETFFIQQIYSKNTVDHDLQLPKVSSIS